MQIGITLPAMIPGADGDLVLEWARRADAGPFSSLTMGERIAYPSHDVMTTLAAAAAVTRRIRLVANIVVLPLHSAPLVAKQAATIDDLSRGRFTLGIGVGARAEDFRAAQAPFAPKRYKQLEAQVALMRRIWSGEAPEPGVHPIGPPPLQPGGPPILVGAIFPDAIRRSMRWAHGILGWSFEPNAEVIALSHRIAREAWTAAGRSGAPHLAVGCYFGLGRDAAERLGAYVRHYQGFLGEDVAASIARSITTTTPRAIAAAIRALADIGTDELILVPTIADIEQIDRLADLVG
jgi:alkanesulfonate monooxygenase SsuD/methylene tetrahydromethanopterin reductase-like flavin-dependent oxidoreductase (luciferase family)